MNKIKQKSIIIQSILTLITIQAMAQEAPPAQPSITSDQAIPSQAEVDQKYIQWPLNFPAKGNDVEIGAPYLNYEISAPKKGPFTVKIGDLVYSEQAQSVEFIQNTSQLSQSDQAKFFLETGKSYLNLKFDENLIQPQKLEIIAQTGEMLFEKNLSEIKQDSTDPQKNYFIEFNLDAEGAKIKEINKFRICLKNLNSKFISSFCSGVMGLAQDSGQLKLKPHPSTQSNQMFFNNEEKKNSGQLTAVVGYNKISILFSSGASYELASEPGSYEIIDHLQNENGEIEFLLRAEQPVGPNYEMIDQSKDESIFAQYGLQKTIWDTRKLWRSITKSKQVNLKLKGLGAFSFAQDINFKNPPKKMDRIYIYPKMTGTYRDEQPLNVYVAKENASFTSSALQEEIKEQGIYQWTFKAPNMDQYNSDSFEYTSNGIKRTASTELYRAYPRELSLRFSGQLIDSNATIMSEAYFQWWFNDLWGWKNYYLSSQRWGFDVRSLNSIGSIANSSSDQSISSINLSSTIFNLKYRFTPGLWMRDESYGLILSTETISLSSLQMQKVGIGFLWARSMPKFFDDIFNVVSLLRKQKWVDFEFIKYVSPLSSGGSIGNDYALNFHGKMMVSDKAYTDVGFGLKRYDIGFPTDETSATIYTIYGTVGLGYIF